VCWKEFAECCSVLQCVTVWCSVLQCVVARDLEQCVEKDLQCVAVCCSVLQCVAVCCSERLEKVCWKDFAVRCSVLQCVAVCCSVLQCVVARDLEKCVEMNYSPQLDHQMLSCKPVPTVAGRRRCVGCFKLQVCFRQRAINYRALLRKTNYKDKASYGSSPPCRIFWDSSDTCNVCVCTHTHMCKVTHPYFWRDSFIIKQEGANGNIFIDSQNCTGENKRYM